MAAQTGESPGGCFRGGPPDRCAWFVLAEAGVHYRFTDVVARDERVLFAYQLGFMVNSAERTALGGSVFGGVEGEIRGGLALRARRWTGSRSSLDLTLGAHLLGEASAGSVQAGSPTLQVAWTYADLVGVSARADVLRLQGTCVDPSCIDVTDRTSTRLYVGAGVGSGLGVVAMGVTGVLFVLAMIALATSD